MRNFNDNSKDTLDEWINFLKNEEIPENPKAKGLLKAKETLDYLKMDDKERAEYESYQKSLHDQASAYESTYVIGSIEGAKKEKLEIAKNLLDVLDKETIALKTGLSLQEVTKLTTTRNE
ncbi:MAG: PD-(D/E)XK nuclease family transposase [Sulfurimonas sp.]|nr:PD-(D/E)XK nuclease family transposase [Sulfurimonas sp.]